MLTSISILISLLALYFLPTWQEIKWEVKLSCVERLAICVLEAVFAMEKNGNALWFNTLEKCLLPSGIHGIQKDQCSGMYENPMRHLSLCIIPLSEVQGKTNTCNTGVSSKE